MQLNPNVPEGPLTEKWDNHRFAKHHQGIIEQFGRFPHRNIILNRESTAQEIDYLNSKQAFKG